MRKNNERPGDRARLRLLHTRAAKGRCASLTIAAMHTTRFIGALALLLAAQALSAQTTSARSEQAQQELEALRDKIESVQQSIEHDRGERGDLAETLAEAQRAVREASDRLDGLSEAISGHEQAIVHLTRQRDAEKNQLNDELDALRAQVRAAYASGQMDKLRMLLSGHEPARLGRMLVYYEYFADAQTRQVERLRTALAALAARQSALEAEQRALAEQRRARSATLDRLERRQARRRETMDALDVRLASRESSLEQLEADEAQLEQLIGSLQTELADLPEPPGAGDFAALKGRMTPSVSGRVLAQFGASKSGGMLQWQGEWRAAPAGAPVSAVAAGRVVYVGYMHRYGLIVVLDHGDNYYTVYGHAESAYVEVGDAVARGQPIARAGTSGGHRQSGAYFEIRKGSKPVDPAHWLAG